VKTGPPVLRRFERRKRYGFIFKSLEQDPKFDVVPKSPTQDPDYRLIKRRRGWYTYYYLYIRDEVLGPISPSASDPSSPSQTTYHLNGHHFMSAELRRASVAVRRDDNAFLATAAVSALQAATDRLSPAIIRKRLEYWTRVVGPTFSCTDRTAINLRRE
jgi:hypothetical protein